MCIFSKCNSVSKREDMQVLKCLLFRTGAENLSLQGSYSTLPLKCESSYRQYGNDWAWLCYKKTLFTKTGGPPEGCSSNSCYRVMVLNCPRNRHIVMSQLGYAKLHFPQFPSLCVSSYGETHEIFQCKM